MKSKVGEKIMELVNPIVEVSMLQAEVSKFPYCAYEIESQEAVRDKHRVNAWRTDVSIYVVAKTESQASELSQRIMEVMPRDNQWDFALQNRTPATDSGHWMYRLEYFVTQII